MGARGPPMNLGREFGSRVRSLRRAHHFTQEGLAERSGLSVDAVRRIERGAFSPSLNTMDKLCRGFGISLRTLFESFGPTRRDEVEQVCDYLSTRSPREVQMVWRVIRAIFEPGQRAK